MIKSVILSVRVSLHRQAPCEGFVREKSSPLPHQAHPGLSERGRKQLKISLADLACQIPPCSGWLQGAGGLDPALDPPAVCARFYVDWHGSGAGSRAEPPLLAGAPAVRSSGGSRSEVEHKRRRRCAMLESGVDPTKMMAHVRRGRATEGDKDEGELTPSEFVCGVHL